VSRVWWDWPWTWLTNHCPSVLWHCWLGRVTHKIISDMTYNVSSGTLNCTIADHTMWLIMLIMTMCASGDKPDQSSSHDDADQLSPSASQHSLVSLTTSISYSVHVLCMMSNTRKFWVHCILFYDVHHNFVWLGLRVGNHLKWTRWAASSAVCTQNIMFTSLVTDEHMNNDSTINICLTSVNVITLPWQQPAVCSVQLRWSFIDAAVLF